MGGAAAGGGEARVQRPPFPTSLDLYRELQAVTPDSLKYLLEDLVATIPLWDRRASTHDRCPLLARLRWRVEFPGEVPGVVDPGQGFPTREA